MEPSIVDRTRLFSVEGIVAVIDGGGTGIGLMFARALAANGARKVYIVGRRKEILKSAAQSASINGNVIPVVGDVTSKTSLLAIAEKVKQEVGYINLLICNSGYYPPRLNIKSEQSISDIAHKALQQDPEEWNRTFATNTTAVAFTSFAFLTLLDAGNTPPNSFCPGVKSQILVTTSIGAFNRNNSEAYHFSKSAATHLVKSFASSFAPYHIRVNGIAPGLFPTDLAAGLFDPNVAEPSVEGSLARDFVPAERLGGTSDMAGFVLYAASQAGAYVNGNVMVVDGGRLGVVPSSY
ncbi:hypothetical protein M409DRAFT_68353 [Zasmidium cellare ATCC 36951]|uniref:Uncharacterized protein n=1 Tax=Zasmidium cellare ATCC 36951 TaxID=1080233 RepID=A0A6A6CC49_ZASCE|nr:uncharacterized protein M409DRAFT_68353 [Zasmidium cellare ATCC 36951]KAF2163790.1 hypothetical protein M409DRAFT_68353 [Zasmidium cellare ATCC 36951]